MTSGGFVIVLKSFQNKKGKKNLRYLTKKQKEKDCYFVGYLNSICFLPLFILNSFNK